MSVTPILCPEPGCDAQAWIEDDGLVLCRVWEAMNAGGAVWTGPEEGHTEVLQVVEVVCASGHRSRGPVEMLDGR